VKSLCLLVVAALLTGCASPILRAASNGDNAQVTDLLAHGANIEDKVASGCGAYPTSLYGRHAGEETPLICAAINGRLDTVKLLLDKGANINAGDFHGRTALWYATNGGTANAAIADMLRVKMEGGSAAPAAPPPAAEPVASPAAEKPWWQK
jgi:hypothetical protein